MRVAVLVAAVLVLTGALIYATHPHPGPSGAPRPLAFTDLGYSVQGDPSPAVGSTVVSTIVASYSDRDLFAQFPKCGSRVCSLAKPPSANQLIVAVRLHHACSLETVDKVEAQMVEAGATLVVFSTHLSETMCPPGDAPGDSYSLFAVTYPPNGARFVVVKARAGGGIDDSNSWWVNLAASQPTPSKSAAS